ncbi:bacillithiol biosynthesis deacetylase BshB1 [Saprospiraceae bacterium]|nr:bacillithiol biosynthesis deacetylase BshB1 [Saprospiraceae bacterium]
MVKEKLDILAIGVHPDDIELGCGATILKQISLGYKVGFLDLTQGELGTRGTAEIRIKEAEAARAYANADVRVNLGMKDGFFQNTPENKLKIIEVVRRFQPDVVLANATHDRHPDHGNASKLIYEACFLSGLSKIITTYNNESQPKWRPRKILNYIQDYDIKPDVLVDVTDFMDKKVELVLQYKSQFYDPNSTEDDTPISSPEFIDKLKGRAIEHGRRIGVRYGEGFTCRDFIGVEDIMDVL